MSRLLGGSMVVVCLLGSARAVVAQQVTAGLKAGVSAARLPGVVEAVDAAFEERSKWGGMGGIFVSVPIDEMFAIQPEVLYAMRGASLEAGPQAADARLSLDLRYLELPILLKVRRPSHPFYVLAGPAFAFRLSAEGRETVLGETETMDVSAMAKRVDIGIAVGAGASFGRFLVEGRWTEGLRDLAQDEGFDGSVRNRVFAVLAGVRF